MNLRQFLAEKGYKDNPRRLAEDLIHLVFLVLGLVAVGSVLVITIYLVVSGLPAIIKIGPVEFLFGTLLYILRRLHRRRCAMRWSSA